MPNVDWKKFVGGYALVDIDDAPLGEVLYGTISAITHDGSGKLLHILFIRLTSLEAIGGTQTKWRAVTADKLKCTIHSVEICNTTLPETLGLKGKNNTNRQCLVYLFTPQHPGHGQFNWSQVTE